MSKDGKTYAELLKDPRWQKLRLEILNRDEWRCRSCWSTEKTLHVDHQRYERGAAPWEASPEFLQTLCEDCHRKTTELRKELREGIGLLGVGELLYVRGFVMGHLLQQNRDLKVTIESSNEIWGISSATHIPCRKLEKVLTRENLEITGAQVAEMFEEELRESARQAAAARAGRREDDS